MWCWRSRRLRQEQEPQWQRWYQRSPRASSSCTTPSPLKTWGGVGWACEMGSGSFDHRERRFEGAKYLLSAARGIETTNGRMESSLERGCVDCGHLTLAGHLVGNSLCRREGRNEAADFVVPRTALVTLVDSRLGLVHCGGQKSGREAWRTLYYCSRQERSCY